MSCLSRRTAQLCALLSIVVLTATFAWAKSAPSLQDIKLGKGPYARMHMLVEKTILAIDVANLEVRVDPKTESIFARLTQDKPYSTQLEGQLAQTMFQAGHAVFELEFLRDISLDQYMNGVRESLAEAHEAGLINTALRKRVERGLPNWFKALKASGFHDGDRVLYEISPTSLRTVVITKSGRSLVDRTDAGADKRMILLGSYFAPGSDYRTGLLSSLGKK